jgi:hypothetical protein
LAAALSAGANEASRDFVDRLEPDQRSRTLDWLGGQCKDTPSIEKFFLNAKATKGEDFWKERYYRGLADCRTPGIQTLLSDAISGSEFGQSSRNRTLFFSLLEVYARNLAESSIPTLSAFCSSMEDEAEVKLVVSTFADAANVGSTEGINPKAAEAATTALVKLGPSLPVDAIEAARDTLRAVEAKKEANQFAKYRWPDAWSDGYTYAAVATEIATCKNGKEQHYLHVGEINEDGTHWPDKLASKLDGRLTETWALDHAAKCKGTSKITTEMSAEPSADHSAWLEAKSTAFTTAAADAHKSEIVEEAPMTW